PLREPFYPMPGEEIVFPEKVRVVEEIASAFELTEGNWQILRTEIKKFKRVLVVAGQGGRNDEIYEAVQRFCRATGAVFVTDVISNHQREGETVNYHDVFLGAKHLADEEILQPDLLITFHQSLISKNLKLFLRKQTGMQHWHVQPAGYVADTFQSL